MESNSDIRFEVCGEDEAKNIIISGAFTGIRTASLPVKLDNSAELFLGEKTQSNDIMLKILDSRGQTIGIAAVADLDFKNRHCQINFAYGGQDMSVAQNIFEKVKHHCKNKLNLTKISVNVLEGDELESRLANTGFEKEVTLKQHKFLDGAYHNVAWYSYLCDSDGVK